MATPQPAPERENLAGLVERVTFHNEDSGFCVLRVKARGQRDLITVIGHAAAIGAGEFVQASGRWVNDRTHGVQFRADFLRAAPPTTAEGIEKYLASGMIKGIGPIYAKKLVKAFKEQVFNVIEGTPERLQEVDGIGPKRADSIVAAWADQKAIREIMIFLHSHGVGTSRAVRIFKTYGANAIRLISETEDVLRGILTCKAGSWSYEHEWRLIRMWRASPGERSYRLNARILSIYFGLRMPRRDALTVIRVLRHCTGIEFYEMVTPQERLALQAAPFRFSEDELDT